MATIDLAEELPAGELETDHIPVRRLDEDDLTAVVRIDEASTGATRTDFYRAKIRRAIEDSSMQLSLAAEADGMVVGFLVVAFYYGEFGIPETTAVVEALGVHPEYRRRQVGRALIRQLEMNLGALGVEAIRTEVDWSQLDLLGFLQKSGFAPAPRFCLAKRIGASTEA
jgi:ribosomal protein S18 acetylase RimI-like enzyme